MARLFDYGLVTATQPAAGGGVWSFVSETVCAGGEQEITFPAGGTLPSGAAGYLLEVVCRAASFTSSNAGMALRFNGDSGSNYRYVEHHGRGDGTHAAEGTAGAFTALSYHPIGRITPSNAPANAACFCRAWIPFPEQTSFWKQVMSDAVNSYFDTVQMQEQQLYGSWMNTAAITSILFRAMNFDTSTLLSNGLAAGSRVRLWRLATS